MDETVTKLIARRKEVGLSQARVSEKLGVGQSRVSVIEAGTHGLLPETLAAYADAVDARVITMVVPKEQSKPTEALAEEIEEWMSHAPDKGEVAAVLQAVRAFNLAAN